MDFDRLAHQLRSPVMVIRTLASLAARRLAADDPNRDLIESIKRECIRLDDLIEGAGAELECGAVDLPVLLAELQPVALALARERQVQLSWRTEAAMPVVGDALALREVLMNLLDNAFKYTGAGGTVTLNIERVGADCRIEVSDTGEGIGDAELVNIFEPYYRGEAGSRVPGQGLGLAIALDLVERMHGQISVDSDPGRGSAFTVCLPIAMTT